jgi:hypothetical protein
MIHKKPCCQARSQAQPRTPDPSAHCLHLLVPKSAPLTLTLPPPVLPSFVPATLDAIRPSNDTLSVRDPARPPALIATIMLPSTPPLILHTADVSDTHAVASMPDCPARPCPLYLQPSPAPAPNTQIHPSDPSSRQVHSPPAKWSSFHSRIQAPQQTHIALVPAIRSHSRCPSNIMIQISPSSMITSPSTNP